MPPDLAPAAEEPPLLWKWRPYTRSRWAVGLDLGQSYDPSAVAVVERMQWYRVNTARSTKHKPAETEYRVHHLERLPLGVPYPAQARHVQALLARREELSRAELVIDSTGVGRAVHDLFRAAGLRPAGVTITASEGWTRSGGFYNVGKLALVSRLQSLVHSGELKIPAKLEEGPALEAELQNFRVGYGPTGYASFGAREGQHDDLVLAVAIAVWWLADIGGRGMQPVEMRGL